MTVHHVVEAARADLPGTQSVAQFAQVDTNLGIVACTNDVRDFDEGINVFQWTLTPVHVTPTAVSAGTGWTPASTPPYTQLRQQLVALSGGKAIYLRVWTNDPVGVLVTVWSSDVYVLVTDGATITVDSQTSLNTALSVTNCFASDVGKTAALGVILAVNDATNPPSYHRLDVGSGSITASAAVGLPGLFVADDYTVQVLGDHANALDGTGAVTATVSYTVAGLAYTLRLTTGTLALVGAAAYATLGLNPLTVLASGAIAGSSPIIGGTPFADIESQVMTIDPNFALITEASAGEATFFYLATLGSPPADVFTFGYSPPVGWDHDTSTPMSFIDGVDNGGAAGNRRFWPFGVGDGTVVVAWNAGLPSPTVAVLAVTVIAPPIARLTVTPPVGTSPDAVILDASASSSALPLTYSWDFGDGATASGSSARSHTYTTLVPHLFSATVTVQDEFGQADSVSKPVMVGPAVAPPQRAFPRDDGLGMSTRRSFPPPTSDQYGIRRAPGEWYR